MERRQHAMESYGTEPEMAPYPGIEVVNDPGENATEKYYITDQHHQRLPASETLPPKKRICGLSRPIFFLAVALSVLAIIVIGLGAGLGVALNKAKTANGDSTAPTESAGQAPATSPSSPTSASSPAASTSAPISTPSSTSTTNAGPSTSTSSNNSKPSSICPSADDTILRPTLGDVRYRVACDSDFSGSGKETLASFVAATWDECLGMCNTMNYFQGRVDIGCTWNVAGTGQQTPGTCWCLGGADKTVVSNKGNIVAVPL